MIVATIVWCYWLSVLFMIVRSRLKHHTAAGAVPHTGRERWMWLVWVPTVLAWLVLPVMGFHSALPSITASQWIPDHFVALIHWLAVVAALLAYVLTVPCWLTLGSNWSLAVVPGKKTNLVTHGWYSRIRHPIYALGLLLMLATVVVLPSPVVLMLAAVHSTLVILKVANEERYLTQRHGQAYLDYCGRTGRFLPRMTPAISYEQEECSQT
jgi:protein-S-isoprenylcysteine O-methyltransferase Ste14